MASQEYAVVITEYPSPPSKKSWLSASAVDQCISSSISLYRSRSLVIYALTDQYKIEMVSRENLIDGHPVVSYVCGDAVTAYLQVPKEILGKKEQRIIRIHTVELIYPKIIST